jgi:hypothetical protein
MIIDGMRVEVTRFDNLYELLKVEQTHYILKFELNKDDAIYYMIADGPSFALLAFCFDKNFTHENIKIENGKAMDCTELNGTTIVTVKIEEDTFLEKILECIYPDEEKPKKKWRFF